VKAYIRKFFSSKAEAGKDFIVDKTLSNIFRIDFIREVFPESRFLHIVRDGRDNALGRVR
jgi:hypothetical protein